MSCQNVARAVAVNEEARLILLMFGAHSYEFSS